MLSWFSKSDSVLGIDIGTSDLKVAQVTRSSTGPVLDTYGIVTLSTHLEDHGTDKTIEITADVLGRLLKQARAKATRCVISLPSNTVFTSVIDIPLMADKEIAGALEYEAKKYIPLPIADVILSWSVIGKHENKQSVLLTAVPKQVKERYVQLFDLTGLDLEVIEIEALALIRSLIGETRQNCAIIDIGAKATSINMVNGGYLQLSRSVGVGGDTMTERLASALGVTFARAQQFKHDFGLTGSPFLPSAITPVLTTIKTETRQLLALYRARGLTVDQIIMTGGGSALPSTVEFFSDLGIPVVVGDPLSLVSYPAELAEIVRRHAVRLAVAVGLALRT